MKRTLPEIQVAIFELCEELRQHGAAAKEQGYQAYPFQITRAILSGHQFHAEVGRAFEQAQADAQAAGQVAELTAMQRKAGAFLSSAA